MRYLSKTVLAMLVLTSFSVPSLASSHREAPLITESPKVDGTDFYLFRSYEPGRGDYVTLVANYQPLQDPYGGPNYFSMDPDALYEIHIDNNGDAREDISFQFRFSEHNKNIQLDVGGIPVSIPLKQAGQIFAVNDAAINVRETYQVSMVRGNRRSGPGEPVVNAITGATVFDKPIDNIGLKSLPEYADYAAQHIYDVAIPGCDTGRMFVGQRNEPFVVNLGETFDLVNIAVPATDFDPAAESLEQDSIANANITALVMEVPISCLTSEEDPVIGAWTTASLPNARYLGRNNLRLDHPRVLARYWQQVSRLGMPLVNEVVIGLQDKDRFNASEPRRDGQFATYVTNPTLPELIEILYPIVPAPNHFPRTDLVTAFLTGIPGLNQPQNVVPSEMMRLNTAIDPVPKGSQQRLGVLAGDAAGFPNGRRPGDDVVDIELRVAMGVLCTINLGCTPEDAPAGAVGFTDGAFLDDSQFDARFPYLTTPIPGSPAN